MKKIYSFIFAAVTVFAAASCQKEVDNDQATPVEDIFTVTATVGLDTKTTLDENGKSTLWTAGDKISVFDVNPAGNNCCFEIATEELPAATAEFKYTGPFIRPDANVNPDPFLVALYPYQSSARCDFASSYKITGISVPTEQTAKADGFDSAATFALAIGTESTKDNLKFNNLYSLLKFIVADEGVKSVTVAVNTEAKLAGEATVQLAVDPASGITGGTLAATGSSSVTLECEDGFTVGETYYIAVAPVSYTSLTVSLDETVVKTVSTAKTLNANTIYNLGNLQVPAIETPTFLYLKPNSNWTQSNARFAAYFFFDNGDTWVSMTDSDSDGIYEVEVPDGYPSVIFCRMNPGTTENNWDNKWNQTVDLTLPTDDNLCFVVKKGAWDKNATDEWMTYADAKSYVEPTILYLKPNTNWKSDGARFAAAILNKDKTQTEWVSMETENDYYKLSLPSDFVCEYVIFCRMNPGTTENNWDNKWNQTSDLIIPTDGKNLYTVKDGTWDYGGGTWSNK